LIVKRKPRSDNQLDLFTQDSFDYRAILSNNNDFTTVEVAQFYNRRGNMERQFDILKNDFGWKKMPYSTLDSNTVFLGITAFIKNLYSVLIHHFSNYTKLLKSTDRVKKFLFRFILLPSKWIKRSRQFQLRIFTKSYQYSVLTTNTS